MKIILFFSDLHEDTETCLEEWIRELIANKSPENKSPLRYADKVEVEK